MEFLLGAAAMLALFALVGGAYLIGKRQSVPKQKPEPMSEEQKRKAQEIKKAYHEVMSYDVDKARGGTT